jgi:glycosyltransferase involved in cell wall biosynthesis
MRCSVVVAVFNEAESVPELHRELRAVMDGIGGEYEVVFVDDGSTDDTARRIAGLQAVDPRVRLVRLQRNCGKSAAYSAGFATARGELVVTLDGDLQDDPKFIPALLGRLEPDYDLVVGWKQNRLENEPGKTVPSRLFNLLKRVVFGLRMRDSNSGFRVMRRAVAAGLDLYGDNYRFIPELAHLHGFRVAEEPVQHRKRRYGRSRYGVSRFWTGVLDLLTVRFITGFTHKPLHFFGTIGLVPVIAGCGLEVYVLVRKLAGSRFQTHLAALIIGVLLIMVGIQLVATGLVGEMVAALSRYRVPVGSSTPGKGTSNS